MAESGLFSLASNLLSASTSLEMENPRSRKELKKFKMSVETIRSVLIDAENKQEESIEVRSWIGRVSVVLNDADHLLDEFITNLMQSKNQTEEKQPFQKVQHFLSSKLSPFVPFDSLTKRVKATTKSLREICEDMKHFNFELCLSEQPTIDLGAGLTGEAFDIVGIHGRDRERMSIVNHLIDESNADETGVSVIGIVGIGGMGKTTLAELICNDSSVRHNFECMWWATIGDTDDAREVFGKIFQSIRRQTYQHYSMEQLQSRIRESLSSSGKYLLVLDDVWADNRDLWPSVMSLLSSGAKGSKIIVTTRSFVVPRPMQRSKCHIHELQGISREDAWNLFKRMAFTQEQEKDMEWIMLGKEIVDKCQDVPLVLQTVAALLRTKTTMAEWLAVKNEKNLSDSSIISRLKLSYNHLSSNLKRCFAYCSLFPKGHVLLKRELIYLWIAQGYVKPGDHETVEAAGDAYFICLFNGCFFQEANRDHNGDIISCKMHDFIHDLARHVAGAGSIMLTNELGRFCKEIRHVSFGYEIETSWNIPLSLAEADQLRSLLKFGNSCSSLVPDQLVTKFKYLRALDLHNLNIEKVPSSVAELKYLRYLNLSQNTFPYLPDSITMLVNLLTLNISHCHHLEALPTGFRKLINLRHLDISDCHSLWHMPPGFGELTSLVVLSDFKVSKRGGGKSKSSGLDALAGLKIREKLTITYDHKDAWRRDELLLECNHIPEIMKVLTISDYPTTRIPCWWKERENDVMSNLQHLVLIRCKHVKNLPPLNRLPKLRILQMYHLHELEYIDESEAVSTNEFFRSLEKLVLVNLPKLKGWSIARNATANEEHFVRNVIQTQFDRLSHLEIKECHQLKSMPPSPHLQTLCLETIRKELVQQLVSTCSFSSPSSSTSSSSRIKDITISCCTELTDFPREGLTNLRKLEIRDCTSLKKLQLASNALEQITISNCPVLELWCHREDEERGVDWRFLTNLRLLNLDEIPEMETLPDCLQQLRALGKLKIEEW